MGFLLDYNYTQLAILKKKIVIVKKENSNS